MIGKHQFLKIVIIIPLLILGIASFVCLKHNLHVNAQEQAVLDDANFFPIATENDEIPPCPFFKNIIAAPTSISANIIWDTTSEATNSTIEYGTTTSYGTIVNSTVTNTEKTSFKADLSDLTENTTYHFRLNAKRTSDNQGVQSDDQTFKTTKVPFTITPKVISHPTSADISWKLTAAGTCNKGTTTDNINFTDPMTGLVPGQSYTLPLTCTKTVDATQVATITIGFTTPCTDMTEFKVNTADYYKGALISWTSPTSITGAIRYRLTGTTTWSSPVGYTGPNPSTKLIGLIPTNQNYDYEIYSGTTLPPATGASCLAKSGTLTTAPLTLNLTIDSSTPTTANLHWKANLPVKGNIKVCAGHAYNYVTFVQGCDVPIATIPVDEYTKDKVISYNLPLQEAGIVISGDPSVKDWQGHAIYPSSRDISFFATAITDDNTATIQSNAIPYLNRPTILVKGNSAFANNTITGTVTITGYPGYENYYDLATSTIDYTLLDSVGGVYQTAYYNSTTTGINTPYTLNAIPYFSSGSGNPNGAIPMSPRLAKLTTSTGLTINANIDLGRNDRGVNVFTYSPVTSTWTGESSGDVVETYPQNTFYPTPSTTFPTMSTYYTTSIIDYPHPLNNVYFKMGSIIYGLPDHGIKSVWTYKPYIIPQANQYDKYSAFIDSPLGTQFSIACNLQLKGSFGNTILLLATDPPVIYTRHVYDNTRTAITGLPGGKCPVQGTLPSGGVPPPN